MFRFINSYLIAFVLIFPVNYVFSQSSFDPDTENVFLRFDRVRPLVEKWNKAINKKSTNELDNLYADSVDYYASRKNKKDCIDGKTKWISEHPGFKQRLAYIELYYLDEDENAGTIIAELEKVSYQNGDSSKVTGFLYFKKFNGVWQIIKESDQATEINLARKKPLHTLSNGKYYFYHGYTADYRGMNTVYDLAGYSFTLDIMIEDKKITGEYNCYSGGLRENTNYIIPGGKIKDGVMELIFIWNGFNEYTIDDYYEGNIPAQRKEVMHFKIASENELICLDKDGYIGGKALKKVK